MSTYKFFAIAFSLAVFSLQTFGQPASSPKDSIVNRSEPSTHVRLIRTSRAKNLLTVEPLGKGEILGTFDTSVLDAVEKDDFARLERVLGKKFNVNSLIRADNSFTFTLLHLAVDKQSPAMVEFLLKKGASSNVKLVLESQQLLDGMTPLHLAAFHDSPAVVKILIKGGASLNSLTTHGRLPMHVAALRCSPNALRELLADGASAVASSTAANLIGYTPLHAASEPVCPPDFVQEQKAIALTSVVSQLLAGGAKVNAECCKDYPVVWRPLTNFAGQGYLEAVKLLVQAGADKDFVAGGFSALGAAEKFNRVDVVNYLRSLGAKSVKK